MCTAQKTCVFNGNSGWTGVRSPPGPLTPPSIALWEIWLISCSRKHTADMQSCLIIRYQITIEGQYLYTMISVHRTVMTFQYYFFSSHILDRILSIAILHNHQKLFQGTNKESQQNWSQDRVLFPYNIRQKRRENNKNSHWVAVVCDRMFFPRLLIS